MVKSIDEHLPVFGDNAHPFGQNGPAEIDPVAHGANHLVFADVACHFKLGGQRQQGLGGRNGGKPLRQELLSGAVKPVPKEVGHGKTAIMEQDSDILVPKVPKARCVARHPLGDPVVARTRQPGVPHAFATLTNPQRQPISARKIMVVACATGDIAIA